jgi:hypothetical protein
MSDDATPSFASAIHDHLELRRRNASLEFEMPLASYLTDDGGRGGLNIDDGNGLADDEDTVANVAWPE